MNQTYEETPKCLFLPVLKLSTLVVFQFIYTKAEKNAISHTLRQDHRNPKEFICMWYIAADWITLGAKAFPLQQWYLPSVITQSIQWGTVTEDEHMNTNKPTCSLYPVFINLSISL